MSQKNFTRLLSGSTLALSLVLTGCWGEKHKGTTTASTSTTNKNNKSGTVLCSINGKPTIYESDFVNSLSQIPYFRGVSLEAIPADMKKQFLSKLVEQELVIAKAFESKVTETAEFKKEYEETMKLVEKSLAIKHFESNLYDKINISNEAIENSYKENKERFVKVAGGISAAGAKFDSETEANKFLEKVKNHASDFDKLAKENKQAKFKNFGRVSKVVAQGMEHDSIPEQVKAKILATETFPHVEKVTIGKDNVWVVVAHDKQNTVYQELDEVKKQLEDQLKYNEAKKVFASLLEELKSNAKIAINNDYFQSPNLTKDTEGSSKDAEEAQNRSSEDATTIQSTENSASAAA